MNYGETLAYWYLRLNGFFPLRNFVLHRADIEFEHTGDADLLAVRFPHTYEEIGGQGTDWDNERFRNWDIDLTKNVAVIGDVKTGGFDEIKTWRKARLRAALQRFGFVTPGELPTALANIQKNKVIENNSWVIAKILFSRDPIETNDSLNVTLRELEFFIFQRFRRYSKEKDADRLFFPDELIQYLAYQAGIN